MLRAVKDILLISFPAVLVLIWDFSMYSHNYLFRKSIIASTGPNQEWYFTLVTSYLGFLLFPFLGVLADVWIGRYKAILVGISLCFVASGVARRMIEMWHRGCAREARAKNFPPN